MDGLEIHDSRFAHFILANAPLEELASGFRWIEGLVWMGDADCLLFQDLPRDRTMRWSESAGVSVFRTPSHFANGQTRDRQGRLIACSHRERCLFRTELDGSVSRLVDRHDGKRLNAPNDVVVKSDGTIWFTDPLYGIQTDYEGGRQASEQPPAVYRLDPVRGDIRIVASDFDGPNGLAFSPDERRLYISISAKPATRRRTILGNIFAPSMSARTARCPAAKSFTRSCRDTPTGCAAMRTAMCGQAPPTGSIVCRRRAVCSAKSWSRIASRT